MFQNVAVHAAPAPRDPVIVPRPPQTVRVKLVNAHRYAPTLQPLDRGAYYFRHVLIGEKQTRANMINAIAERYSDDWLDQNTPDGDPPGVDWKIATAHCFVATAYGEGKSVFRIKLQCDNDVAKLFAAWKEQAVRGMWTIVIGG